jgi:hypothetical protein
MRAIIYLGLGALGAILVPFGLSTTNARTPSVASLKGTWIWQEIKYPTTSGDQVGAGPAAILASVHFDGTGEMIMDYDVNINGTYSSTNAVPGSYSVDLNGHGSFSFTSPASGYLRTYDFRVSPSGDTLYTIAQSDGTGSVTQRLSVGACTFRDHEESGVGHGHGPAFFH